MRCAEGGNTPPRESIAGRDGDGRVQAPNRRSKTTEEDLIRRFGHFQRGIPRSPRSAVRIREGGPGSPGVHRRLGRRLTPSTTQPAVQSRGGESPPSFQKLWTRGSRDFSVLYCEKARWRTRLPGCPSPVGTAMDAFNHPTDGPKRRRTVSSALSDTWCSGICESPGAAVRKGERAPASRVSIARRDDDGRVQRRKKWCRTAGKSLPRGCAPLSRVDRRLPPRRESKCAGRAALPADFHGRGGRSTPILHKFFIPAAPENSPRRFPPLRGLGGASIAPLSADVTLLTLRSTLRSTRARKQTDRQTDRDYDTGKHPPRPTIKLRVLRRVVARPSGALRLVFRPLRKNTRIRSIPRGADRFVLYIFIHCYSL